MMTASAPQSQNCQGFESAPTTPASPFAYRQAPYPTEIDRRIERVLYNYLRSSAGARLRMEAVPLSAGRVRLLLTFADRMASLALCEGNERFLALGRAALSLVGKRARQSELMPLHLLMSRTAQLLDPES